MLFWNQLEFVLTLDTLPQTYQSILLHIFIICNKVKHSKFGLALTSTSRLYLAIIEIHNSLVSQVLKHSLTCCIPYSLITKLKRSLSSLLNVVLYRWPRLVYGYDSWTLAPLLLLPCDSNPLRGVLSLHNHS